MTLLRCLFALLILFASAPAQDEAAKLDAVKEFTKYVKKTKDEPLLVEAVLTLKGQECVAAAEELFKMLKHPSALVQQAALGVLETYTSEATYAPWLTDLQKNKDHDLVATVIKVVGRARLKSAVPAIEAAANEPKANVVVKYEAARALRSIGDAGSTPLLGNLIVDKEAQVRMAALDAVAALRAKAHAEAVTKALDDPEWQVQSAAVKAAAVVRPQSAVQPLIDLMKKTGRLQEDCADALFRITALDFGLDPERWQTQWNNLMSIPGWRIPTDEELKKKEEGRKKYDALYGKKQVPTKAFAGIPTTSTNVLFIIDVSGSMDDLVVEVEKFQEYKDRKRFTIVQKMLLDAIDGLDANTNFDILSFATDTKPWKGRLVPANVVNKDAAKGWARGLKPIGGTEDQYTALSGLGGSANLEAGKTNTLKALLYAFGIDPDNPPKAVVTGFDKEAIKRPLDTVYFLSDGRPSVGKLIDTAEILKEVTKHNEVYRMVIHTIAIGDFQKEFLQQLASQNGGVFVDLGR
ncbi:MAG: HEAT repeat domain-containing protein [Planctomycetes bacterium]|nr:HEAT repeat domain-containing protein [Planctomycetota bacterium]